MRLARLHTLAADLGRDHTVDADPGLDHDAHGNLGLVRILDVDLGLSDLLRQGPKLNHTAGEVSSLNRVVGAELGLTHGVDVEASPGHGPKTFLSVEHAVFPVPICVIRCRDADLAEPKWNTVMCVDLICLRRERTLFWYGVVGHEHWEKEKGNGLLESGDLLHSY